MTSDKYKTSNLKELGEITNYTAPINFGSVEGIPVIRFPCYTRYPNNIAIKTENEKILVKLLEELDHEKSCLSKRQDYFAERMYTLIEEKYCNDCHDNFCNRIHSIIREHPLNTDNKLEIVLYCLEKRLKQNGKK